jgi:hypothetical protein
LDWASFFWCLWNSPCRKSYISLSHSANLDRSFIPSSNNPNM